MHTAEGLGCCSELADVFPSSTFAIVCPCAMQPDPLQLICPTLPHFTHSLEHLDSLIVFFGFCMMLLCVCMVDQMQGYR